MSDRNPPSSSSSSGALAGRVAWVTGGATGIGAATARALATDGARVAISGRRQEELARTAAALSGEGLAVHAFAADVADAASVADAHARIAAELGTVDVLACCAGTNVPNRFWKDMTPASFSQVVRINLDGVANGVHAVLPGMRAKGGGTIVIVSSWAGHSYLPFTGIAYGASKTALGPLAQTINFEEGRHGIRASLVMPGEVATPILKSRPVPPSDEEMARMLRPEDVADAIRYVAAAPAHVCLNEILIGPVWNRIYIGADDLKPRV